MKSSMSSTMYQKLTEDVVSESSLVLTNRYILKYMKQRLMEMDYTIMSAKQECDGKIIKGNKMINDLLLNKNEEYNNNTKKLCEQYNNENNALLAELQTTRSNNEETIKNLKKQLKGKIEIIN